MRVYSISGKLWDVTIFQEGFNNTCLITPELFSTVSKDLLNNRTSCRGLLRTFSDRKIRVKAKAIIEHSPTQHTEHIIYYDRKGYYSNVKGKKVYLEQFVDDKTIFDETIPKEFSFDDAKTKTETLKNQPT